MSIVQAFFRGKSVLIPAHCPASGAAAPTARPVRSSLSRRAARTALRPSRKNRRNRATHRRLASMRRHSRWRPRARRRRSRPQLEQARRGLRQRRFRRRRAAEKTHGQRLPPPIRNECLRRAAHDLRRAAGARKNQGNLAIVFERFGMGFDARRFALLDEQVCPARARRRPRPGASRHGSQGHGDHPGYVASDIRRTDNHGKFHAAAKDPVPAWLQLSTPKAVRATLRAVARGKREAIISVHGKLFVAVERFVPGSAASSPSRMTTIRSKDDASRLAVAAAPSRSGTPWPLTCSPSIGRELLCRGSTDDSMQIRSLASHSARPRRGIRPRLVRAVSRIGIRAYRRSEPELYSAGPTNPGAASSFEQVKATKRRRPLGHD